MARCTVRLAAGAGAACGSTNAPAHRAAADEDFTLLSELLRAFET